MPKKRPGVILTDKQWKFCTEYVVDLNATQAAIRAGYSEDSARSTASALLGDPDIQDYVHKLQENAFLRLRISPDEILAELARIAFSEIEDYEGDSSSVGSAQDETLTRSRGKERGEKPMQVEEHKFGDEEKTAELRVGRKRQAVLSYKRVVVDPETGSRTTVTFSIHHKIMALRILGMHCGLFVKGKGKFRGDILTIIRPRGRTPEEESSR